jgi:hypothetical protein
LDFVLVSREKKIVYSFQSTIAASHGVDPDALRRLKDVALPGKYERYHVLARPQTRSGQELEVTPLFSAQQRQDLLEAQENGFQLRLLCWCWPLESLARASVGVTFERIRGRIESARIR